MTQCTVFCIEDFVAGSKLWVDIIGAAITKDLVESSFLELVMAVFTMKFFKEL